MESFYTDYSLKNHNTFQLDVSAKYFYEFSEIDETNGIHLFFEEIQLNDSSKSLYRHILC